MSNIPSQTLNKERLTSLLFRNLLVGFNSSGYDLPMIQLALTGASTAELKEASDDLIVRGMRVYDFAEKHGINGKPSWNHIDLIDVAPLKASLKLYAGRLHCKKLQDLPIDPNVEINAEQAETIVSYCINDLDNTATLYAELAGQIQLREAMSKEYHQDLRSRSDAQVAEHVIAAEVRKINGIAPKRPTGLEGKSYSYAVPDFVSFATPQLKAVLETIRTSAFTVGKSGSIELPAALAGLSIRIEGGTYRIGIGGLHSSEVCVSHVADDETLLIDRDVASYYPSIILNLGLYPSHLGEAFLTVYQGIVRRRLEPKRAGDKITAESLKIAANGSFGKFGSQYSALYAPDLLIQVTLTGQLSLLMLIETLELGGIPVVSANTDGILIKRPVDRQEACMDAIADWEKRTGFETEETRYSAVYSKDVNNYLAIKKDGSVKGKGLYSNPWSVAGPNIFKLHKNPSTTIVIEAVIVLLRDGTPLEDTIRNSTDIRKFLSVRTVNGGASAAGVYVGKVVRWFYSKGASVMNYRTSGYKVPKSDGSKPLMELPDVFPDDVNYDWYIAEARETLRNIGYGQPSLFS